MTVPVPPSPGDYQGAASAGGVIVTSGNSSTLGSTDIWGLGDLYGKSVYLGDVGVTAETQSKGGLSSLPGVAENPTYGSTQSYMQHVVDLWAAQQEERQKFPKRLTTYEQLQRSLWQAGFFGQTAFDSVHVGQWNGQTQDALVSALTNYEQLSKGGKLPLTFTEFLNQNAVMGLDGPESDASGSGSSTRAPFQANLDDPTAIRAAAQSAAQQALGRNLSDDQLAQFVQQFQAEQTSAQRSAYNGNNTTPPDLGSDALGFVQENDPKAFHQNQRSAYMDALVNLLGGTRPSVTPTPSVGG